MALPSSSGAPTLVGPVDGANLYRFESANLGSSGKHANH
jgi:hypothetical protein